MDLHFRLTETMNMLACWHDEGFIDFNPQSKSIHFHTPDGNKLKRFFRLIKGKPVLSNYTLERDILSMDIYNFELFTLINNEELKELFEEHSDKFIDKRENYRIKVVHK